MNHHKFSESWSAFFEKGWSTLTTAFGHSDRNSHISMSSCNDCPSKEYISALSGSSTEVCLAVSINEPGLISQTQAPLSSQKPWPPQLSPGPQIWHPESVHFFGIKHWFISMSRIWVFWGSETAECRSKIADFKKQIGKYLDICEYNTWRTILIMHIKGFYSDTVIPSILRPQHRNSLRFPAHVDVATAIGTFPASPSYWDDAFSVPATRQTMNILQRSNLGLRQCPFKLIETSRISEAIHGPTQLGKLGYNA